MDKPRVTVSIVGRFRDGAALACDQRYRDGARLSGDHGFHAFADDQTQALECGFCILERPWVARGPCCDNVGRTDCITRRTHALEPRPAGEIVASGEGWHRRRAQRCPQANGVAGFQAFAQRHHTHADARRLLRGGKPPDLRDADREPGPSGRARLDQLDDAFDVCAAHFVGEYGRARPFGTELGDGKSQRSREPCQRRDVDEARVASSTCEAQGHYRQGERHPEARLRAEREIGGNSHPQGHRQPDEPAGALLLKTLCEPASAGETHDAGHDLPRARPGARHRSVLVVRPLHACPRKCPL